MAAVAVLLPLLTGRGIYCAHVCPYGSAQDLAAMLWRWRRPRLPRVAAWTLQTLRGVALIALFVAVVAGVEFDLTAVEPFAAFQWRSAPLAGVFLALGFVLVSVFLPRTWCLHLCPTGYLLGKCRGLHAPGEVPRTLFTFERGALLAALAAAIVLALPRPEALPPALPGAPVPGVDMGLSTVEPSPPYSHEVPDVLTAIHERRSVRHYTDDPVMPAQLDTLVRAAMAAPTAGNAQPWSFIVVTEQKRLQGLSDALPYGKMLAKAGAAIVVCGVPAKALPGEPAPLWVLDCTAAAENLLLAAHGIGLGAVWVAAYPYEERMAGVRTVCGIPAEIQPLCVISLGVPAGVEQPKDKYSSDNVHWEKW
jgi:nitroreductase